MSQIFISYRRDDSQDVTGRISENLCSHFGKQRVFKDVDAIPPGENFPKFIKLALAKAKVILVIIGPQWVNAKYSSGSRRLEDPNDYVRLEIEIARGLNIPIIPVILGNTHFPNAEQLPPSVRFLLSQNTLSIRPDPDFQNDMGRLYRSLKRYNIGKWWWVRKNKAWIYTGTMVTVAASALAWLYIKTEIPMSFNVDQPKEMVLATGTLESSNKDSDQQVTFPNIKTPSADFGKSSSGETEVPAQETTGEGFPLIDGNTQQNDKANDFPVATKKIYAGPSESNKAMRDNQESITKNTGKSNTEVQTLVANNPIEIPEKVSKPKVEPHPSNQQSKDTEPHWGNDCGHLSEKSLTLWSVEKNDDKGIIIVQPRLSSNWQPYTGTKRGLCIKGLTRNHHGSHWILMREIYFSERLINGWWRSSWIVSSKTQITNDGRWIGDDGFFVSKRLKTSEPYLANGGQDLLVSRESYFELMVISGEDGELKVGEVFDRLPRFFGNSQPLFFRFRWITQREEVQRKPLLTLEAQVVENLSFKMKDNKRHSTLEAFSTWEDFRERWKGFADHGSQLIAFKTVKWGDEVKYLGAWRLGDGKGALYSFDNWDDFSEKWETLKKTQRLIGFDISKDGSTWYTGTWHEGEESGDFWQFKSWEEFKDKWEELENQRLIDLEVTRIESALWFAGVWQPGEQSGALFRSKSWKEFMAKWEELNEQDQRLINIEVDQDENNTWYTGVWQEGTGGYALSNYSSWAELKRESEEFDSEGYYLVDFEALQVGNEGYYIGVWR